MSSILALDVGGVRVGVAIASRIARLPRPLTTLQNTATIDDELAAIIKAESVDLVVVGLPRGLSGQETAQTAYARGFTAQLPSGIAIEFQDEALTSKKAESELQARGKPFTKGDIDALAATYILEDFLTQHGSTL